MSELHDILWTVCPKLSTDFEPYGERDRANAEPSEDCSCGCVHFVPLAGELGNDWGVCANRKSPRAGLLTFEHQGCPEFESFSSAEPDLDKPGAQKAEPGETERPQKKLKVRFHDIQAPLEGGDSYGGEEVRYFLDTDTGEVLALCREFEDYEELCERVDGGLMKRYLPIDRMESRESFQIMEDFANSVASARFKHRLLDALSRAKPFRRFKDAVNSDLALRNAWFQFHDAALAEHARDMLADHGIEVEWAPLEESQD